MTSQVELWGGVEASVVRLGNAYRDQCADTGHERRPEDLDLIAALGIRTLRYPFLWERCAPHRPDSFDWKWCDSRAEAMRKLGLSPIAGLLHHGSGPRYTELADPDFPALFERYAHALAARYPWIEKWTPINEPLTTARFSGLYGVWYPHGRNENLFWRMLLNQVDATKLATKAIRGVNSNAQLIQTEDLGCIVSTPECQAEALFQNERRWLTWDLLCGRVNREHPLWHRIVGFGHEDRLLRMLDTPCIPDVIGINHYLTSNRFLDGRHAKSRGAYADLEAVRAHTTCASHRDLLEAAWHRYHLPVAITEVHNGCTREEQLRWAFAAWTAAVTLHREGVPVRAVTLWALFGCQDWASLLTRRENSYETGVFDARGRQPRPTALALLAKSLAEERPLPPQLKHIVRAPGWWERDIRFTRPPAGPSTSVSARAATGRPILIIGQGRLGSMTMATAQIRGLVAHTVSRPVLEITDHERLEAILTRVAPWAVINTAAYNGIARSEANPDLCFAINTEGAVAVAQACASLDIACVTCSTDLIFDGRSESPYRESDQPAPLNVYGQSKLEAESRIATLGGRQLIVRSGTYFGAGGAADSAAKILRQLEAGARVEVPDDRIFTPSYLPDVANAILDLLIDGETGIWHLTSGNAASWYTLAMKLSEAIHVDPDRVLQARFQPRANWPRCTPLASDRALSLPSLDDAIARFTVEARSTLALSA